MNNKIAVIGLGYVGLPLARLFATKYDVVGFDINETRVRELQQAVDFTHEVSSEALQKVLKNSDATGSGLICVSDSSYIENCNIYIITVPTPVDKNNNPDLKPLYNSSKTVGSILKKGDIIIYESTVFPGATEEECVPILEKESGLKFNTEFFVGYSPERINPGDKKHTVDKILKVTSGSTKDSAKKIDALYASVITAGTHLAPSIKVAEAAKVIENSQRDINIAFVNELAKIFNILDIDTKAVLAAAATKWNFIPFSPGLVGGHCIGVDPYYLAQKAQSVGYHPEIILAGRRMNDSMGQYVASEVVKLMLKKDIRVNKSNILLLGFTFKENCPDVRNTRVIDVYHNLVDYGIEVSVYDPLAKPDEVEREYGITISQNEPNEKFDAIVLAVAHTHFKLLNLEQLKKDAAVVYDIKGFLGTKADKIL